MIKFGALKKRLNPRQLRRRDWIMLASGAAAAVIVAAIILLVVTLVERPMHVPLKPQTTKISSPWIPATVKHWEGPIDEMAKKYNIDPDVLAIIMTLESGGYSKAESEIGAKGLMQITPPTAQDIAKKYLKKPVESYDLNDPRTSIEFGAAYLAFLRDEFGERNQGPSWNETVELITAGYNGGPGAAGRLYRGEGLTDTQTIVYSRDAYNMWRERHAQKSPTFDRWLERGGSRLIEQAQKEQSGQ